MSQKKHVIEQHRVIGDGYSCLARINCFAAVEAEAADVAPSTDRLSFINGAVRVRTILNYFDLVAVGNLHDAIHLSRIAPHVDNANGLCPLRDSPLDVVGICVQRSRVNVAENRCRPALQNRSRGCVPGIGRNDNFFPRAYPGGEIGAVQSRRAVTHS